MVLGCGVCGRTCGSVIGHSADTGLGLGLCLRDFQLQDRSSELVVDASIVRPPLVMHDAPISSSPRELKGLPLPSAKV